MSEHKLKLLAAHFERLRNDCDTREKAEAQLRSEGLLDQSGHTAPLYRDSSQD